MAELRWWLAVRNKGCPSELRRGSEVTRPAAKQRRQQMVLFGRGAGVGCCRGEDASCGSVSGAADRGDAGPTTELGCERR